MDRALLSYTALTPQDHLQGWLKHPLCSPDSWGLGTCIATRSPWVLMLLVGTPLYEPEVNLSPGPPHPGKDTCLPLFLFPFHASW